MSSPFVRHLNLSGASNFRDLGGYPGKDGRLVRWRQIFRSNHLGHLTPSDTAVLRELGVRSAFDFRGVDERNLASCAVPDIEVHSLPIEPTVVAALSERIASGSPPSAETAREIMRDCYRSFVRRSNGSFQALFAHLLQDRAPLVIHCTAGKDRTGFACALVLHALGVAEDLILEDYLLTNRYYRYDPNVSTLPIEVRQAIGTVEASFLIAAFEAARADFGSIENYLSAGLGVGTPERALLERRYLAG